MIGWTLSRRLCSVVRALRTQLCPAAGLLAANDLRETQLAMPTKGLCAWPARVAAAASENVEGWDASLFRRYRSTVTFTFCVTLSPAAVVVAVTT